MFECWGGGGGGGADLVYSRLVDEERRFQHIVRDLFASIGRHAHARVFVHAPSLAAYLMVTETENEKDTGTDIEMDTETDTETNAEAVKLPNKWSRDPE